MSSGQADFDDTSDTEVEVWAAGGVVVDESGRVLLVHRPKYDDWTLPKGKLDDGESLSECALREVEEETGLDCELAAPVGAVRYLDDSGRLKEVRYWLMRARGGRFQPNPEVDAVDWVDLDVVDERLSYEHDGLVVTAARAALD